MRILTEKPQEPLVPKPTILMLFDLFKGFKTSPTFLWMKVFTNSTDSQLSQNAQFFEHTTGKRVPCGRRDEENTITDGHDGN